MVSSKLFTKLSKTTGLLALTLALASCVDSSYYVGTTPTTTGEATTPSKVPVTGLDVNTKQTGVLTDAEQQLLKQARSAYTNADDLLSQLNRLPNKSNVAGSVYLQVAQKYYQENKTEAARVYLRNALKEFEKNQQTKTADEVAVFKELATNLAYQYRDADFVQEVYVIDLSQVNNKPEVAKTAVDVFFQEKDYRKMVNFVDANLRYLNKTQAQSLVDYTLDKLMTLSTTQLKSLGDNSFQNAENHLTGWFRLAQFLNVNSSSGQKSLDSYNNWYQVFSTIDHSAARFKPTYVAKLEKSNKLQGDAISKVAVLLPFTEPGYDSYSIAIRQGLDQANADRGNKSQITYFDTAKRELTSLMETVSNDYGLVIGPLTRTDTQNIANLTLTRPQVVLNLPTTLNASACYFSLRIEDEAETAGRIMNNLKVRNPVIFTDGTESSARAAKAFADFWLQNYQQNVRVFEFDPKTLDKRVEALIKQTPRPTGVYFLGPQAALTEFQRSLNYYAPGHSIATVAPNKAHNSMLQRGQLIEYRNVYITDSAVIGQPELDLAKAASKSIAGNDLALLRLYGFGYDAYALAEQYNTFYNLKDFKVRGANGELSRDNSTGNCVIKNSFHVYKMDKGSVTPYELK